MKQYLLRSINLFIVQYRYIASFLFLYYLVHHHNKIQDIEKKMKRIVYDIKSLREKCSDTEVFLVRIFPHLDWIRQFKNTDQKSSVFAPFLRSECVMNGSTRSFVSILLELLHKKPCTPVVILNFTS